MAAAASVAGLCGVGTASAADGEVLDVAKLMAPKGWTDIVEGSPEASVTVIEYASPTCPHCAVFHNTVYPAFKSAYIDSGKVKFILRPFVRYIHDVVIFSLALAAGEDQYENVISTYFKTQDQWAVENPKEPLLAIAKQLGFTEESFNAALTNQELLAGMEELKNQALDEFDLTGTPTFYINGKQVTGEKTLEELAAEIDPLLPAGAAAPAAETPEATPAQ